MAIRDILDYNGVVVGQLELDDSTPEEVWDEALAKYAVPPLSAAEKYLAMVEVQQKMAPQVMSQIRQRLMVDFHTLADAAYFYDNYHSILAAIREGAFQTAVYMLQQHSVDAPATPQLIADIIVIIQNYFGT